MLVALCLLLVWLALWQLSKWALRRAQALPGDSPARIYWCPIAAHTYLLFHEPVHALQRTAYRLRCIWRSLRQLPPW